MAEQSPPVQNKTLLIVAVVVALVVVIIHNWHISQVRRAAKGETIKLLAFTRNIKAGERIDESDLKVQEVETRFAEGLGDVVKESPGQVRGYTLNQPVQLDLFVRWSHILGDPSNRPSRGIREKMEGFTLPVDPRSAPGTILSVGDRVALIGHLAVRGGRARAYRIIEGVKVLEIGGLAGRSRRVGGGARRSGEQGQRSYRSLTIEVTDQTALQLHDVLSHVQGSVRVVVLSPSESDRFGDKPEVLDALRGLGAAPPRTARSARPPSDQEP